MSKQYLNNFKNPARRWEIAQQSEKDYWNKFDKEQLTREEIERHKKKAKILEREWKKYILLNPSTKVLQIGCGPEDIINYLSTKNFAIDPLADFYKNKFSLDYGSLEFVQARGEEIPYPSNYFDIIILANVLDHTESPKKVLEEVYRVLKSSGIFHFENLFYQKNFLYLASVWKIFQEKFQKKFFNIHHPYMFSLSDIRALLFKKFKIIDQNIGREIAYYENLKELKKIKLKQKSLTIKLPALFGLYGTINYIAICKKS